jgi:hypothetical protein
MRTTARLLLTFAAPFLTAAPASAWHHRAAMPAMPVMPMMGMPMMGMPMMGVGMMPTMPLVGMGVMPTTVLGGGGMSMSLSMSGDMTLAMLAPGLLRNLVGSFLGVPGAAGMTEQQVAAIGRQLVSTLLASEAAPMTRTQADQMTSQLQRVADLLERDLRDRGVLPPPKPTPKGQGSSSSPALERARAEVRRLAAEGAARPNRPLTPADLERARAEVRRLAAESAARPSAGPAAPSDLERARAEVRRLAAEGMSRQTGQKRPAGPAVVSGAK